MKEKIVRLKTNMGSWQRGERRRRSWKWLEVDGGDGSNQLSWRRKPQSVQQPARTSHTASLRSSPSSSSNSFAHYSHTNIFNLQFLFLIFSAPPSKTKKKTENNYERGIREVPERQVWTACPYATEDRGEEELCASPCSSSSSAKINQLSIKNCTPEKIGGEIWSMEGIIVVQYIFFNLTLLLTLIWHYHSQKKNDIMTKNISLIASLASSLKIYLSLTKTTVHLIGKGFAHATNCYNFFFNYNVTLRRSALKPLSSTINFFFFSESRYFKGFTGQGLIYAAYVKCFNYTLQYSIWPLW